ncbi:MAG: VanZ family protein [Candidatus Eisenbacteria bacterium]|nr:VanZ family protein [Candidatus Eisenbacteria bacterium]
MRYWLPVAAYVSLIFVLSAQPNLRPPFHFQNSDKLSHLLEYGVLGVLLARAMRATLRPRSWLLTTMLTMALGLGIGAGDEFFQSFVPGRDSTVFDWLADGTGITFAQLAYLAAAREREA